MSVIVQLLSQNVRIIMGDKMGDYYIYIYKINITQIVTRAARYFVSVDEGAPHGVGLLDNREVALIEIPI